MNKLWLVAFHVFRFLTTTEKQPYYSSMVSQLFPQHIYMQLILYPEASYLSEPILIRSQFQAWFYNQVKPVPQAPSPSTLDFL